MTQSELAAPRVHRGTGGPQVAPGVRLEAVPSDQPGSTLSSALVDLAPGATWEVEAGEDQVLLYTASGEGRFGAATLSVGTAVRLGAGETGRVEAGTEPLRLIVFRCGPECDEHAPLGTPAGTAHVDLGSLDAATSGREFQVLFDMHNGSSRGTLFLGKVPPGAAPWHFHQYDEIVWILDGHGLYHLAGGDEEFEAGSAFRVRRREVHIVENAGSEPMLLLGLFTPAGSPAAAFLASDPRRP